jgi:putative drug exporter of the RND superfamily
MSIARRTRRPVPGSRFARTLRRLRWPLMIAWLIAVMFLFPVANSLSRVTNDSNAANLPASAPSTRAIALELQQATRHGSGQPQTDTAFVVFARGKGLTDTDRAAIASARAAVGRLAGQANGLSTPSPVQRSADGQAALFTANITAPANSQASADTAAVRAIREAVGGPASRAGDGLRAEVTGPAAVTADQGTPTTTILELTALVIVALVFFVVYRSPLLWFFPLLSAVAAIQVAQAGAHGLGSAGLTVSTLSSDILIVLVFGAASDYALLLIHRYREELCRHATTEDAMAAALRRTLPTLLASSATVTIAMICLLAAQSASLHGLGPVGAVGIVSALLAQTTFLPALLLVVGPAAFWPRVPVAGQTGSGQARLWSGIGSRVARHPARVALAAVVLLGVACTGLAALRIDNSNLAQVKGNPGSVAGAQLADDHFPAGLLDPVNLLAPPSQARAAVAVAQATPNVAEVLPAAPVGSYTGYLVIMSVSPYGASGHAVIVDLRQQLDRDAPGTLVGGDPAVQYDITRASAHDALVLIPLVLVVILVVIGLLLQAVVAPLVLVTTTALSFAASFGLSDLLWRYGLGYSGIESQVPVYIFIFLVALGIDYNIFLAARIREEARHLGTRRGTLRGLSVTGGVITAAGVVLAATFAALVLEPTVYLTEVGTAVAIGVLLDTLFVRTVLVPAALLTIGERVWWPTRPGRTQNAASTASQGARSSHGAGARARVRSAENNSPV